MRRGWIILAALFLLSLSTHAAQSSCWTCMTGSCAKGANRESCMMQLVAPNTYICVTGGYYCASGGKGIESAPDHGPRVTTIALLEETTAADQRLFKGALDRLDSGAGEEPIELLSRLTGLGGSEFKLAFAAIQFGQSEGGPLFRERRSQESFSVVTGATSTQVQGRDIAAGQVLITRLVIAGKPYALVVTTREPASDAEEVKMRDTFVQVLKGYPTAFVDIVTE